MHKSKELVVLLSGTGKAARTGQRVDLAVDICPEAPRRFFHPPHAAARFLRQSFENKCQQNRFLVGKGIDR